MHEETEKTPRTTPLEVEGPKKATHEQKQGEMGVVEEKIKSDKSEVKVEPENIKTSPETGSYSGFGKTVSPYIPSFLSGAKSSEKSKTSGGGPEAIQKKEEEDELEMERIQKSDKWRAIRVQNLLKSPIDELFSKPGLSLSTRLIVMENNARFLNNEAQRRRKAAESENIEDKKKSLDEANEMEKRAKEFQTKAKQLLESGRLD